MTYRLNELQFTLPTDDVQDSSINILKFADLSTSLIITRAVLADGETLRSNFTEQLKSLSSRFRNYATNHCKMFASVPGKMLTPSRSTTSSAEVANAFISIS